MNVCEVEELDQFHVISSTHPVQFFRIRSRRYVLSIENAPPINETRDIRLRGVFPRQAWRILKSAYDIIRITVPIKYSALKSLRCFTTQLLSPPIEKY
mmetsp:Transcript_20633/g.39019  ORF Transcript_20633/g.39019 Transcript_20633/m.39019 type:complete len:98 (+) Transcript_20633:606-899(+)